MAWGAKERKIGFIVYGYLHRTRHFGFSSSVKCAYCSMCGIIGLVKSFAVCGAVGNSY